jgi:hypothetical protein
MAAAGPSWENIINGFNVIVSARNAISNALRQIIPELILAAQLNAVGPINSDEGPVTHRILRPCRPLWAPRCSNSTSGAYLISNIFITSRSHHTPHTDIMPQQSDQQERLNQMQVQLNQMQEQQNQILRE